MPEMNPCLEKFFDTDVIAHANGRFPLVKIEPAGGWLPGKIPDHAPDLSGDHPAENPD